MIVIGCHHAQLFLLTWNIRWLRWPVYPSHGTRKEETTPTTTSKRIQLATTRRNQTVNPRKLPKEICDDDLPAEILQSVAKFGTVSRGEHGGPSAFESSTKWH